MHPVLAIGEPSPMYYVSPLNAVQLLLLYGTWIGLALLLVVPALRAARSATVPQDRLALPVEVSVIAGVLACCWALELVALAPLVPLPAAIARARGTRLELRAWLGWWVVLAVVPYWLMPPLVDIYTSFALDLPWLSEQLIWLSFALEEPVWLLLLGVATHLSTRLIGRAPRAALLCLPLAAALVGASSMMPICLTHFE